MLKMIDMAQYFEELGMHRSADAAFKFALRKEAQPAPAGAAGAAPAPTPNVTIGEFFRQAQAGDYMAILKNQLAPFVQESHLGELLKLIAESPVQRLYDRMKNIKFTPFNENKVGLMDWNKNPSMLSSGQEEGGTSEVYLQRKPEQDLRIFLPVLTSWGLELAGLHGFISGYQSMTNMPDISKSPSGIPGTWNTTKGQLYQLPTQGPENYQKAAQSKRS